MDQIRKALTWLKRYHFWVLTFLVAFIALFCWYRAAGKLSKELAANQSVIKSEFSNLRGLQGKSFHPNDDINQRQLEENNKQAADVKKIWDALYARQSENVLKWPNDLSPAFHEYIKTQKFGGAIPRDLRENYRDYIDRHFVTLPKRVQARMMASNETGGGGEGRFGMDRGSFRGEGGPAFRMGDEGGLAGSVVGQDDDYLCEWLDQALVREELNFNTTPSAPKIWVTQENLWAYHTLLDIIAKTNTAAGADRRSNAAVRTIIALEVGRPAAGQARGRIEILQPLASGAEMVPGEGEMPMGESMPMDGREMGGGFAEERGMGEMGIGSGAPMNDEQESAILLAGRYVDATGAPMGGMAAAPAEGDPSLAAPVDTSGPFKRLPIRMTLEMDQRWLTPLIAECASQPLQVEVREVRINPPGAGSGRSGMGYEGGGFRGGGGMNSGTGGGSTYQPNFSSAGTNDGLTFNQRPNIVTVEVQGIIYIFNEPDPALLQAEAGDQMASAE